MDYYDYLLESMDYDSYDYDDLDPVEEAFVEGYMAAMEGANMDTFNILKDTLSEYKTLITQANAAFKAGNKNGGIKCLEKSVKSLNDAQKSISKLDDSLESTAISLILSSVLSIAIMTIGANAGLLVARTGHAILARMIRGIISAPSAIPSLSTLGTLILAALRSYKGEKLSFNDINPVITTSLTLLKGMEKYQTDKIKEIKNQPKESANESFFDEYAIDDFGYDYI